MQEHLFGEEYYKWIGEHEGEDPDRLRLSYHNDGREWIPYAITHIASLRRAGKKFQAATGECMMPSVIASDIAVQQSTSADVALLHADLLARHISQGSNVLDMTCGLGTDTRALARYFNVTSCEINALHAAMARENFRGNANVGIVEGDSVEYLRSVDSGRFQAIFIDPARRDDRGRRVYGISDCTPDLIEIYRLLMSKQAVVMCKLSPMIDIRQTLRDLPDASEVHIIGDGRECKELVFVVDPDNGKMRVEDVPIYLWNGVRECVLTYSIGEEASALPLDADWPSDGGMLWIPSAVAMKGGCFNLLSSKYGINPISSNTHLYVSAPKDVSDFPGHCERILEVIPWKSSELKKIKKRKLKACTRVRNFGMTAQQLSDKLGIVPGDDDIMLTGIMLSDGSRMLVMSTRQE